MSEATTNVKNRRHSWLAVMLSLIMPGLGHIYCGRIVKGLVLAFLSGILVPVIFGALSVSRSSVHMVVMIPALLAYLAVWLIAIIDSWYTARHTASAYILKDYNRWYVYVILLAMSMAGSTQISFNIRSSLLEAFRIPKSAGSMYPTIAPGDRFLANKIGYRNTDPKIGDVVVFVCPENRRWNHVKRVVAVAGDTVEMKDNDLYINGQKLEGTSLGRTALQTEKKKVEGEVFLEKNSDAKYRIFLSDADDSNDRKIADLERITVPEHHCYVIGDNRNSSCDSRHYGPVNMGLIKGRADYLYWPAKGWEGFGRIK
ncbi:MAG TPA: signal peptidase I [Sedimentisphaerales bacterium]|nr:signal peptidase I [Sedimentisphaerales bacterium]